MAGTKTPRTTLEGNFAAGEIPRQEHFYNLLWSSFNQYDDGIQKSQTDPLKIQAAKNSPQEEVLQFYTDFSGSPNWTIGQNPNQDTTKRGLNIEDGSGNSRLFISEADGNVGIGTPSPQSKLDVQGGISIGASYAGTSVAPTNGVIIEGNVGIGTPTPYHNLEVDTNVTSETPVLDQENSYESMKVVIGNQWQSFTVGAGGSATGTVYLVKIEVAIEKCSGILSIYEGRGTSGKKLHSQPYDSSQMEWLTINLNRIIPVTIGQEYTIYASNVRWLSGSLNDGAPVYPYGVSSNQSYSMAFRTYTVTSVNLDPTLTVSRGNVGIGTGTPGFPLSFADSLGDKISLWSQSGAHFGFGIQPNILQIYSGANTTDIAFGYGSSADFTETARIKGNGNVGIGTPSPQSKLDVNGAFAADLTSTHTLLTLRADGQSDEDKSNIGVGFGSSIAFAAQRGGDLPGVGTGGFIDYYLHEMDNDEADRWAFRFRLRDDQWPSNNPNDPGSTVMTLLANGNVGIGTSEPGLPLSIKAKPENGYCIRLLGEKSDTDYGDYGPSPHWDIGISPGDKDGDVFPELEFALNGTAKAWIDNDGSWATGSDMRLKTSIEYLENILEKVCELTPSTYRFKDSPVNGVKSIGFIAQEVEKIFPELVKSKGEGQIKALSYDDFAVLAIAAIKEQQKQIEVLVKKVNSLCSN